MAGLTKKKWVFWIDTITILELWKNTITIRLFGSIPLKLQICHWNTMEYVSDGLGPSRRRIPPVRFPVWPILPPALEVKGVGPPLSSAADRYRRPPLSFPFPSPLCSPNPS